VIGRRQGEQPMSDSASIELGPIELGPIELGRPLS
jgi:hypothetical protein